jgi:hypothetical protein
MLQGKHRQHPKLNRTSTLLILALTALTMLLLTQLTQPAYGAGYGLENLPSPFVTISQTVNSTAVVASSLGHGPCGGCHTMDVMGAIMVGAKLGLKSHDGTLEATMDDTISTYNFTSAKVTLNDLTSNLIVIGGPGVNQVTYYYNNLRYPNGTRQLPAYFDKYPNGTDYIYVASTKHTYTIQYDNQSRIKADYGLIITLNDHGRQVLILAGLGGSGTWASCDIISNYDTWNLHGSTAIVQYSDTNGDGFLDKLTIAESVSGTINLSNILFPLPFELVAAAILPKANILKRKLLRKKRLIEAIIILTFAAAAQISIIAYSDSLTLIFTFRDFSHPFVASGGLLNCTAVVASSVGHGPCGAAHTMDVMGGIMVAAQFGEDATGGYLASTLDDYITTYDLVTTQMNFTALNTNLLLVGGPGVNQVTWYYNNLRDPNGTKLLPAYFDKYLNGTDYIDVPSSGHQYTIEHDFSGRVTADYGLVDLYYDSNHGWWVVIAAGLGGPGTGAASRLLATYWNWSVYGDAAIVKYYDSNGDGYLDTLSIVEIVGEGKSIDLYWDIGCKNAVQAINWGTLGPGDVENLTLYVRNEGENSTTLYLNVSGWNPPNASDYLSIGWNYSGDPIGPGETMSIDLLLYVNQSIAGITNFDVNITISSN